MASSIQATRIRKGMLLKIGNDLFRILDLHHLTPGNKRAHIQVRMRNIRTTALADHKFRAEEDVERAVLDEREMQYLYNDGDHYYQTLRQWERNLAARRKEAVALVGEPTFENVRHYLRVSAGAFKFRLICLLRMSFAKPL